ncbi:uncharacterized protein LOC120587637 [Pteropus medius]|uniref:uncharacterized protein LOC120587637 n=1 Tax=Pteropus vampyrus TaxID=132908 RepID=UPI00196AADB3|nr:uncharacterized protein LOC120587637 [Pteropus giganteus]
MGPTRRPGAHGKWDVAKLESVEKGRWEEPERRESSAWTKGRHGRMGCWLSNVPRPLGDERQHFLGCMLSQLRAVERPHEESENEHPSFPRGCSSLRAHQTALRSLRKRSCIWSKMKISSSSARWGGDISAPESPLSLVMRPHFSFTCTKFPPFFTVFGPDHEGWCVCGWYRHFPGAPKSLPLPQIRRTEWFVPGRGFSFSLDVRIKKIHGKGLQPA